MKKGYTLKKVRVCIELNFIHSLAYNCKLLPLKIS